jgi:2-haloalkanoic acid dehalogenase type II
MARPYDIITFDCYGTLIDWNAGITRAFQTAAEADGVALTGEAVLSAYHGVEHLVEGREYITYREVLGQVALLCAERVGWGLAPDRAGFLADSLAQWQPFPDTNPMLERLKQAGYELGILSNVDDDLFAGTQEHLSVEFDLVVTAEQVRAYKPNHAHFETARERIGDRRWLHAARSYFHDVVPATALGVPVVWVNREHSNPTGSVVPDAEVDTLEGLVTWLDDTGA